MRRVLIARQRVPINRHRARVSLVEAGILQLSFHRVLARGIGEDEAWSFVVHGTAETRGLSSRQGERWQGARDAGAAAERVSHGGAVRGRGRNEGCGEPHLREAVVTR